MQGKVLLSLRTVVSVYFSVCASFHESRV